ncbi:glycosyl hydrolase [Cohnella sp. GCM10020058]|uniref:glycosyl hydrolase n=1 Tax=Cohnella sp. GCM10020058 TaxID=3317330 RepID=UPI0036304989
MNPSEFKEPAVEFRPVPFWSWNGELTLERLRAQIAQMREAGVGGFFMHARNGLKTGYLDEDWYDCVRLCIGEADRLGMKAWIYDEKGWPSGFAGGIIPSMGRAYRAKALVMLPERREDDEICRLLEVYEADGATQYLYEWIQPLGDARFEGASYVDLLDARVTEAFIEHTHRHYEERFGSSFGRTVPGVFSDEACALLWLNPDVPALPWTTGLDALFFDIYGYSLLPRLHALFLPEGDYRSVRYDYWSLVVELFAERFSKALYDWCDSRGLQYTGHLMAEDRLVYQMEWVGDVMRQYEYMHIPGMDHLGRYFQVSRPEQNEQPYTTVLSAKQVTSVANQLGRERALSELFACAGQGFELSRQKWMTDWHLIHGINFFSPHLLPYSMEGEGKRDYPPTLGPQQPWWGDYRLLTDYQARMSYALTRGKRIAPVLVIHPIESAFELYSPLAHSLVSELNVALEKLSLQLLDAHLNFDYGNEHLLDKYGSVSKDGLRIKEAVYQAVIIPACTRLRKSTVRLLEQLSELGFPILCEDGTDALTPQGGGDDGMPESLVIPDQVRQLPLLPFSIDRLSAQVPQSIVVEGEDGGSIWLHERVIGSERLFFLASMSEKKRIRVTLKIAFAANLFEWNAETGEVLPIPARIEGNRTETNWIFEPRGTLLLGANPQADKDGIAGYPINSAEERFSIPQDTAPVPLQPNVLLLDRFSRYEEHAAHWSSLLPLAEWIHAGAAAGSGTRFRAEVRLGEAMPELQLQVVVERHLALEVRWNGCPLASDGSAWLDPDWLCYQVPSGLVRQGSNEVDVRLGDREGTGHMENMYVIGDFSVKLKDGREPSIQQTRDTIKDPTGDLSEQGYPFYAGSMAFGFSLDEMERHRGQKRPPGKWLLRLTRPQAGSVRLYADDAFCGARAWEPWEWDLTDLWTGKGRRFTLVMSGSLRNLIGPHHLADDEAFNFLTPSHFFDQSRWTDRYVLKPLAIGELEIVYRGD